MDIKTLKITLVGDAKTGKSTFVSKIVDNTTSTSYEPTMAVSVSNFTYKDIPIVFYDTAGDEKYEGLRDGYYIGTDVFLLMFDLSNRDSFKSLSKWLKTIRRVCENIPIVLCGTKADILERKIKPRDIAFFLKGKNIVECFNISSFSGYNTDKVLEWIQANIN